MKQAIPFKAYLRVAIQLPFFLILVWYFSTRFLGIFLENYLDPKILFSITFLFSAIVCLLVIKPSIKKEMEQIDQPFSLVARDPNIPLVKEKLTLKVFLTRTYISLVLALVFSFPLVLIGAIRLISGSLNWEGIWELFTGFFTYYYISWFAASMLFLFVLLPQIRNWHWTKKQF